MREEAREGEERRVKRRIHEERRGKEKRGKEGGAFRVKVNISVTCLNVPWGGDMCYIAICSFTGPSECMLLKHPRKHIYRISPPSPLPLPPHTHTHAHTHYSKVYMWT